VMVGARPAGQDAAKSLPPVPTERPSPRGESRKLQLPAGHTSAAIDANWMASPIHSSILREVPSILTEGHMAFGATLPHADRVVGAVPTHLDSARPGKSLARSNLEKERDDRDEEKRLRKTGRSREERHQLMLEFLLNKYS